ncbi:MAG: hypothetical protein JWQ40_2527, partial [Segetibacter sp.]|nr:hypothetical protein [Segetibacter sp.]
RHFVSEAASLVSVQNLATPSLATNPADVRYAIPVVRSEYYNTNR